MVREHGKRATCLREAAPAKAESAAGDFFQHSHYGFSRGTSSPSPSIHELQG